MAATQPLVSGETKTPTAASSVAVNVPSTAHTLMPIYLSWQNLLYNVDVELPAGSALPPGTVLKEGTTSDAPKGKMVKATKTILNNVTGFTEPGKLLAIMGSSGAGKTSLLNALAGRTRDMQGGKVLYNGVATNTNPKLQSHIAFVEQNDLFYKNLTVEEHLKYQAQLRLNCDAKDCQQRVVDIMTELNLLKARNNPIGEIGMGISGGERRRLSFATEILTDPSLLFIDEPTSGLDSFMASEVMAMLKKLAARGRTVVCTIHQPDPATYRTFDYVLLMSQGRVGYFGKREDCLPYFASLPGDLKQVPGATESPAPFLISKFSIDQNKLDESRARVKALQDQYAATKQAQTEQETADGVAKYTRLPVEGDDEDVGYKAGWFEQLSILTSRSVRTLYRDRSILTFRLMQQFFLSLILGILCLRLENSEANVQSRKGAIFFILRFTMFINVLGQLMLFPLEMPIFQREYRAGLYRSDTFFLAKNFAEVPGQIVLPIIFMSIAWFMVGFDDNFSRYMETTGVLLLVTAAAASMGYFLSTLSTSVRGVAEAGSNILTTLMLFDGFLINASSIPSYLKWLGWISIYKWAYELLSIVIWRNYTIDCLTGETCSYTTGDDVLAQLSFSASNLWPCVYYLLASIFAYRTLSYILVVIHARRKPKLI